MFVAVGDGQCHKTPIVMIIAGNERFRKRGNYIETDGLPTWNILWP